MNILICPDKFKGSLGAKEVCHAVAEGFLRLSPETRTESVPLADGGEGTCELLTEWYQGTHIELEVQDPLFRPITARYGISRDGDMAFIEMATASGLTLLKPHERDPLYTTTVGTGEMIADALRRKVRKIILGIGGSATNDAGTGMATALGYRFCDSEGIDLKPTGENLIHIHHIRKETVNPLLKEVSFVTLCDVQNPLYGPDGAAHIYGPQKGANKATVAILDAGLRNFRRVVHKYLNCPVDFPGAGAAGGMGAGTRAFLNASMEKGVSFIIQNTGLLEKIREADLIVTGEGKIDHQTFSGKVVSEVIRLAREAGKPVIAVCGKCELPEEETRAHGLSNVISLTDADTPAEYAMAHAAKLISSKIHRECKDLAQF